MATEQQYDEVIAPLLKAVADRCSELGMDLVARVEWEPGEAGITQINIGPTSSMGQKMTQLAATRSVLSELLGCLDAEAAGVAMQVTKPERIGAARSILQPLT